MNKLTVCKAAALAAAISLSFGCVTVDPPDLKAADVPEAWEGPLAAGAPIWPNTDWWNNFNSPELNEFLEEVKRSNFDLANNQRNLRAAELTLRDAGLARFPTPTVSLSDGESYSRTQANGTTVSEGNNSNSTQLSMTASYGGVLTKDATYTRSLNSYENSVAQSFDAAMRTLGTAASAYFNLLLIRDRLVSQRQNLANAETILGYARANFEAGITVQIDFLEQQINFDSQRNSFRALEQQERSAIASLALLVGRNVIEGYDIEGRTLEDIEIPTVQPGIPSELLWRRPDIYQAERNLRNAAVNVTVARRSLFPNISLTANSGRSSPSLVDFISSPATATFSLSASLSQTLLDTGQRRRNIEASRLSLETSLATYRRTVLAAYNEVDLALSSIQQLEFEADIARRNLEAATESFRLAELRYQVGAVAYQTVLTSQNSLFSARLSVLSNKQARLNAIINFYQALGGGWEPGARFDFVAAGSDRP
jgi:NodT family efflux transporter outer membrane factor (OMF) lipoprotein